SACRQNRRQNLPRNRRGPRRDSSASDEKNSWRHQHPRMADHGGDLRGHDRPDRHVAPLPLARMLERIGPYRIVRKLGEGGMGVVYVAEDERLHRAVAIKTMRDATDSSTRERLFREARAAASLNHPNVCQLFDIGEESGTPFLVMELLEGKSLADRLKEGPLALPDALQFALGILTAL